MRQIERLSQEEMFQSIRPLCKNDHQARGIVRRLGDLLAEKRPHQIVEFQRIQIAQYGYLPREPFLPGVMNRTA